jgi:hypothetical protein
VRNDDTYGEMFDPGTDLQIYRTCAQLLFVVNSYLRRKRKEIDAIYRNNLRYHLMMSLAWRLNGSRPVHAAALGKLKVSTLNDADIAEELAHIIKLFDKAGASDKIAKDAAFTASLVKNAQVKASVLATPTAAPQKVSADTK